MLSTLRILGISIAPRKNRQVLVMVMYAFLLASVALISVPSWFHEIRTAWFLFFPLLIVISAIFYVFKTSVNPSMYKVRRSNGMTSLALKPRAPKPRDQVDPDEREMAIRNAAHYQAFRVIKMYSFLLIPALCVLGRSRGPELYQFLSSLVLLLLVMTLTLPEAVVLWMEPDAPEEDRV